MDAIQVSIKGHKYTPPTAEVAAGGKVVWTNNDKMTHTATADDESWTTGDIPAGESREVTFATAGSFPYFCEYHASMKGTVNVK